MSISEALMASMSGDTATADLHVAKALLKTAVCTAMFCPGKHCGGNILDVKRAVLTTSKGGQGALILCGKCHDVWIAPVSPEARARLDIADGRVLHARRPRKAAVRKTEMIRGTAVNSATGETRDVALSERQVADILNDNEHDTCAGECECQIESDGECGSFWPSRMRAVGMI